MVYHFIICLFKDNYSFFINEILFVFQSENDGLKAFPKQNEPYLVRGFPLQTSKLNNFVTDNMTSNNVMVSNKVTIEMHIYTIGLISNKLFEGAKYFLYTYCVFVKNDDDLNLAIQNLQYLRAYLMLFRILMNKIVDKIMVELTMDVTENNYLNNMDLNLSKMIDITSMSNYNGKDSLEKLTKMKESVQSVYRFTDESYSTDMSIVELKNSYFNLPVNLLDELSCFVGTSNQEFSLL